MAVAVIDRTPVPGTSPTSRRGPQRSGGPAPAAPAAPLSPAAPATLLSLEPAASGDLVARLRAEQLNVGDAARPGARAYRHILARGQVILFDAATGPGATDLHQAVRALRHLAPVILLAPAPLDVVGGLTAGAVNVLDRGLPAVPLAGRIRADLRWIARQRAAARPAHRPPATGHVLLQVLCTTRGAICCHDLRWLLGSPDHPLSQEALRARLHRLLPALHRQGLDIRRASGWGCSIYTTHRRG